MRASSLLLCLAASATALRAQSALVTIVKADTLLVERFTRTATRIEGEVTPKGSVRMLYGSDIDSAGHIESASLTIYSPGAPVSAPPMQQVRITMFGDSATASMTAGTAPPRTQRIASRTGAQPVLNPSLAICEVLIAAARRKPASTDTAFLLLAMGARTVPAIFEHVHTDSVSLTIATQVTWFVVDTTARIVRGYIPTIGATITRVDGIAVSRLGSAPDYSAPTGAPYSAENVTVPTTMGHTLGGTFTKPSAPAPGGRFPAVVSITGSGAQDRDEYIGVVPKGYRLFRQIADTLGRRGIAMLRMDDRGYGASGGDFASATSRDFANDVRAAIAYLRTRPDVDPRRIFLAGHSEGGMVAPMVALDEPSLAGLVLMAGPARPGREILDFQIRYGIEHDTTMSPAVRAAALGRVTGTVDSLLRASPWFTFFANYDPLATARRVTIPVLILQGGDDQQVIASESATLASTLKAAGNRDVTLKVFPELNHLFIHQPGGNPSGYSTLTSNLAVPEVIGTLAEWVHAHAASMK